MLRANYRSYTRQLKPVVEEANPREKNVRSVIADATGIHSASTVQLTLDKLEAYDGMTAVLREYGFLYKDDMDLLEEMVCRHESLRTLMPYAVSPNMKERAFAMRNIARLRAAIGSLGQGEYLAA
ncbi:Uncharacterised protein [Burkholderia pseudomallei]|nr:Uncharacterised protein [Burkholderia pseudomallei]